MSDKPSDYVEALITYAGLVVQPICTFDNVIEAYRRCIDDVVKEGFFEPVVAYRLTEKGERKLKELNITDVDAQ